jgi:hypothetical protein
VRDPDPDPEISLPNRDSAPPPGCLTAGPPLHLHSNSIVSDPMVLALPEDLQCMANGNCATPRAPGDWAASSSSFGGAWRRRVRASPSALDLMATSRSSPSASAAATPPRSRKAGAGMPAGIRYPRIAGAGVATCPLRITCAGAGTGMETCMRARARAWRPACRRGYLDVVSVRIFPIAISSTDPLWK